MNELNALLEKQYKQYRQRMNYLAWHLRWNAEFPVLLNDKVRNG